MRRIFDTRTLVDVMRIKKIEEFFMIENLYIPLMNSSIREETREEYLNQLSKLNVTHIFLAVDRKVFFSRGEERDLQYRLLKDNIKFFQKNSYHVGIWTQAFGFGDMLPREYTDIAKDYTRLRSVRITRIIKKF